jgi:predicted DNA-binding transcriptional regulator AlpA
MDDEQSKTDRPACDVVPFELRAIDAEAVGLLMGCAPRTVFETIACRTDFPKRVSLRPATWVAGEVLKWRNANRAGGPMPRGRRPGGRRG